MPRWLSSALMLAALAAGAGAAEPASRIEVRDEAVEVESDLGMARANATVPFAWRIANLTELTIALGDLKASCPCLSATTYSARTLAPKEEATITSRWYVGPAHGTETVRVTIPVTAGGAQAGSITINATIAVTDLIDIDEGARVVALGKFTAETLAASTIPPVAFRKAAFRPWNEVYVKTNETFATMMVRAAGAGAYEIVFDGIAPEKLAQRPFGVFSETFTLGFRANGRDLEETVRYRLAGHFAHPTYTLSPPQLYWGPLSADSTRDPSSAAGRSAKVGGFVPASVAFQRTTYVYNGMDSSDPAQPFEVAVNGQALEARLATTPATLPKHADKGCSVYLVQGTDDGKPVRYLLPIFFSIPE